AHLRRLGLGDFATVQAKAVAAFTDGIQYFATRALDVGQSTFSFFIGLFVMLYLLFFVLRDGEALAERAKEMLPLRPDQQRRLFTQFATVVQATVVGDIFVAFVQGALGGLAFWLLGVHAALLWAVLMTFASLLPAIGAALIWLPVAGYFLLSGETWQGIFLIGYGGLVIGLIDNLVRPLLVGQATKMPDYLVLVSTLGGIGTFGLPGFIIGPLIAAMFIALWNIDAQARRSSPER
ncbi:MAG: AI-2E family transporter, partial [Bosea sp. (in: a-proteobacteria)]